MKCSLFKVIAILMAAICPLFSYKVALVYYSAFCITLTRLNSLVFSPNNNIVF